MKATNDQGHIIDALKDKKYNYVWEQVKFIGYRQVPDIEERYIFFFKAVDDFNPYENNNFIHFYKKYLSLLKFDKASTFVVTENRSMIKKLQTNAISPSDEMLGNVFEVLKNWK